MMTHDPFDIWATERLGRLKYQWYQGHSWAKLPLGLIYVADVIAPNLTRNLLRVEQHEFAHILAMLQSTDRALPDSAFVHRMSDMRNQGGWGLPFKWYSMNGIYPETTPYITNTPYVMEALTQIPHTSDARPLAETLFNDSWSFLNALKVKHKDATHLALSYAPVDEPHIVVNANSYSAYAYALHHRHGLPENRDEAEENATKLCRWVVDQQYDDGRWYYLAERGPWDMIDGFHSCFVVRNLRKTAELVPTVAPLVEPSIEKGWNYIRRKIYHQKSGLCRRYAEVSRADPFKFDLYDQAEYLGLLLDFGEFEEAELFAQTVRQRFCNGADWYCRIDRLGRRWGRNFLRWGIVQFWVHEARLNHHLSQKAN
ncbi:MAG TPA: hypothetical protein DD437_12345 [Rhodobiaceae bacterium]|nr:hypothetical protein [Rhodobiaceae bacterium]|tara:strand:- start:447 stop:1556 length:1110 start_codon:yes stop_codon:yes gene_type:complete